MKRIIITLMALLLIPVFLYAAEENSTRPQAPPPGGPRATAPGQGPGAGFQRGNAGPTLMEVVAKLELTAEQKTKLEALKKTFQAEVTALKAKNSDAEELLRGAQAQVASQRQRVMAILTDEQRQKVEEQIRAGRGGMSGMGRMDPMARYSELGLTEEQTKKIKAIEEARAAAMRKIFEEAGENREGLRDKMMAVNQKADDAIKAVLTPEQREKFEQSRSFGLGGRGGQGGRPGGSRPDGGTL